MRMFALLVALVALALMSAAGASAHNAGYVIVNGECQPVGSDNPGPDVPEANPNRNTLGPDSDLGNLDLIPETPGDQYGARFAAEQSPTVYPPFSKTQTCPPGMPVH
jgi:type II secretory pathway pseudopilin PulG